jgi:hypothetical protein
MNTSHEMISAYFLDAQKSECKAPRRWRRTLLASAAALSLGVQSTAWAVCSDGSVLPAGGFTIAFAPATDWTPNVFTGTTGSLFVPDTSVNEHNDPP